MSAGVPEGVSLWVFSTENLRRSSDEVAGILSAVEKKLELLVADRQIHNRRIRVGAVGRLESLPPSTLASLRAAEAATMAYSGMRLTIAAAYGGREEIVDAVQRLLREHALQNKPLKEVIELVTCVYREPKRGCNDDEARRGVHVT